MLVTEILNTFLSSLDGIEESNKITYGGVNSKQAYGNIIIYK